MWESVVRRTRFRYFNILLVKIQKSMIAGMAMEQSAVGAGARPKILGLASNGQVVFAA